MARPISSSLPSLVSTLSPAQVNIHKSHPKILTYKPSSFDITMPVLVIGTGLGEAKKNILLLIAID
jgi:hypothetical protein